MNIENAQKAQYVEFSQAWDQYMKEYEETALDLMDKLKVRHQKEIEEQLKYQTQLFYKNHKWSKQIVEARKQEKIYSQVKDYVAAEGVRQLIIEQEMKEMDEI